MTPEAAALVERLRKPGESYEALAARLPISLSTLYRWKRGSTEDYQRVMSLLEMAGWLNDAAIRQDLEGVEAAGARELAEEAEGRAQRDALEPPLPEERETG